MGKCARFRNSGIAIFHAGDTIGRCGILRELCANGFPMGLVGSIERGRVVGGMDDYVGTIDPSFAG